VKNEKLAFLSANTKYTLRFAMQIGGLCRAMTIKDVGRLNGASFFQIGQRTDVA
jgi:hypothetical protein